MAESLWGLKIIAPKINGDGIFFFPTIIGIHKKGDLFASNPSIRKVIKENNFSDGTKVGYVQVRIDSAKKIILLTTYRPIGMAIQNFDFVKVFTGKGAAALIEHQINRYLLKQFPDYDIRTMGKPSIPRYNQLKKMDRTPGTTEKLSQATQKTKAHVVRGNLKWRKNRLH